MNGSEELQFCFSPTDAERLGREAGLGPTEAGRVLREGLPLLLAALADHARTPEGERQITEAGQNLPRFTSVAAALGGPEGAATLQRAGQLLGPALLGPRAEAIARRVTGGSDPAGVGQLLQMTLPLVLSSLGGRGTGAPALRLPPEPGGEASPGPRRIVVSALSGASPSGPVAEGSPRPAVEGFPRGGLSAGDLIEVLRTQLGGGTAARLGTLAGYGPGAATRAAQTALPVVLGAIARKGRGEAGAAVLLARSGDFERLVGEGGHLDPRLLDDPDRVAGVMAQGRGLLGTLFSHPEGVRLRLASAVGGSAENAGRLLALLAPLVLGLLVRRAHLGGLDARRLAALLAGVGPRLPGLLPAGVPGLGSLLHAETAGSGSRTRPAPPRAAPPPSTRRRGVPWWLIPLPLLLLLGGGFLLRARPAQAPSLGTAAAVGITVGSPAPVITLPPRADPTGNSEVDGPVAPPSETFDISEPVPGAQLPPGSFTLRGSGTPAESLQILEDGTSLGNVTVGGDGTWSLYVPTPSPGPHTYAVYAEDATELGRVRVTVDAFATLPATGRCDREFTLSLMDGQIVRQPFRFGGVGQGEGYRVTVRRRGRVLGTRDIPLDPTCGWSYQSRPGPGPVTYEVRSLDDPEARPLDVVRVTVRP